MNHSVANDTIVEEITIQAPADRIFTALTSPQERVMWWGAEGRTWLRRYVEESD